MPIYDSLPAPPITTLHAVEHGLVLCLGRLSSVRGGHFQSGKVEGTTEEYDKVNGGVCGPYHMRKVTSEGK